MKKKIIFILISLFFSFAILAGSEEPKAPIPVFRGLSISNATPESFSVVKNELAVLYVNNKKLRFRAKTKKIILDEGQQYDPRKTWLVSKGKYVYAFWWLKFTYKNKVINGKQVVEHGKSLYVRASDNFGQTFSQKVRINSGNGILPNIEVQADNFGHVSVVYSDEREPNYQVYVNSSVDGGKTWLKHDFRLDKVLGQEVKKVASYAGTPHLVRVGKKLISVWQQFDENNGKPLTRIIARESQDNGITWQDEEVVYRMNGDRSSTLDVLSATDEVYIFWLDKKKQGILLFSRKENENQWFSSNKIAPGTSTNFAISWLKGVADKKTLYLTFTYEKKPLKDYVATIKYNRKKRNWYPEVHRLDRHDGDAKYKVQSIDSDIVILPNKAILVVWEDYDSILPGVHADILNLKSQKWLDDKLILTKPGSLDVRKPRIYLGEDKLWIVFYYNLMIDGAPPVTALASLSYKINKDLNFGVNINTYNKNLPDSSASRKIIKEKVIAIWEARLLKDKKKEWPYYDPVFRSRFNQKKWLKLESKITYTTYSIESIEVHGIYARVRGSVNYKLPKKIVETNTILDPEDKNDQKVTSDKILKSTFSMKFGWFDNDWYFIPELMFMNHIDG